MLSGRIEELPDSLVALSTTGLLQEHDPRMIEKWIDALVGDGPMQVNHRGGPRAMTAHEEAVPADVEVALYDAGVLGY